MKIEDRQQLERLIEGLANDIVLGSIHFRMHQDLHKAVEEFEPEMSQSRGFWSLTISAHLQTALYSRTR
jgi:hypothetical protein